MKTQFNNEINDPTKVGDIEQSLYKVLIQSILENNLYNFNNIIDHNNFINLDTAEIEILDNLDMMQHIVATYLAIMLDRTEMFLMLSIKTKFFISQKLYNSCDVIQFIVCFIELLDHGYTEDLEEYLLQDYSMTSKVKLKKVAKVLHDKKCGIYDNTHVSI